MVKSIDSIVGDRRADSMVGDSRVDSIIECIVEFSLKWLDSMILG